MSSPEPTPRRTVLLGLSASTLASFWPASARAGAAIPVTLRQLVDHSSFALVGTPKESDSQWEGTGQARRIVTYSRVEVHQPIDGRHPDDSSLVVRTLGGRVKDIGQLVHGEAAFELGKPAVFFLRGQTSGLFGVTAMAQGHYPLRNDAEGTRRLNASPKVPDFIHQDPAAAVSRLRGRTLADSERMIFEELGQ